MILTDTNILVYAVNSAAPQHEICRKYIEAVREKKLSGVLLPQIILEFYAITTNQKRFPAPLSPGTAWEQIELLSALFPVIDVAPQAISKLKAIAPSVRGGEVFDAYIAAQMKQAGISVICTYNRKHFEQHEGIFPLAPEEILNTRD